MYGFIQKIAQKPKTAATTVAAAATLIAAPFTAHHEGLRTAAYLDPVGIPTICYGETDGVKLGDEMTKEECNALFEYRLGFFAVMVDMMIEPELSPKTHAAVTSFTYNVGLNAFRNSTMRELFNQGAFEKACKELPKWKYAGGRVLPGLVKRRAAEMQLCLEGLDVRV